MPAINSADPTVQVAIISLAAAFAAAVVGLLGVVVGGRISAKAARESAQLAAVASRQASEIAREVAQADRDEARAALFADRVRVLAGQLETVATRHMRMLNAAVVSGRWQGSDGQPELGREFEQLVEELLLVVRMPSSVRAISRYFSAVDLATESFDPTTASVDADERARWSKVFDEYVDAECAFVDAMRVELGREPVNWSDVAETAELCLELGREPVNWSDVAGTADAEPMSGVQRQA